MLQPGDRLTGWKVDQTPSRGSKMSRLLSGAETIRPLIISFRPWRRSNIRIDKLNYIPMSVVFARLCACDYLLETHGCISFNPTEGGIILISNPSISVQWIINCFSNRHHAVFVRYIEWPTSWSYAEFLVLKTIMIIASCTLHDRIAYRTLFNCFVDV